MDIGVELPRNDALLSCGHRKEYASVSDMRLKYALNQHNLKKTFLKTWKTLSSQNILIW